MSKAFKIEPAAIEDMKMIFDLSNDELVRRNSFKQEKISWENHQTWFKLKINDENVIFYVVKDMNNKFIAQVRFDKKGSEEVDISISISPDFRGKGYGVNVLKTTSKKLLSESKTKKINAYIKKDNIASKTIFEKAGYVLKEENLGNLRYEYNAK